MSPLAYVYHERNDEEFKEESRKLAHRRGGFGTGVANDKRPWQEKFLERYTECHDRIDAARFAGVRPTQVRDALSPESPDYEEELRRSYDDIEMEQTWKIVDGMKNAAAEDDAPMSVRKAALGLSNTELGRAADTNVSFTSKGEADADAWLQDFQKNDPDAAIH